MMIPSAERLSMVTGFWLMAHGSRLMAHTYGSKLIAHGSWPREGRGAQVPVQVWAPGASIVRVLLTLSDVIACCLL